MIVARTQLLLGSACLGEFLFRDQRQPLGQQPLARGQELRALAGGAKLSVDVLPACSHLTPGSGIKPKQRDAYLAALEARMGQLAGHV